jgi:alpha-tubulin suppressor-like RCC1 family protein
MLSAGGDHTCAFAEDASVWCWGSNAHGELAVDGGDRPVATYAEIGTLGAVVNLTAGVGFTCFLTLAHDVYCIGDNSHGQLGAPLDSGVVLAPAKASFGPSVEKLVAGDGFTCALYFDGGVDCVGEHDDFQLGSAQSQDTATPVRVPCP